MMPPNHSLNTDARKAARSEALRASPAEHVDEHLVGELIASEVEVRTGRCETFAEAAEKMGERRAQLSTLTSALGVSLAATGTHPWARWQDQRIIDTPHYRRNDELLRLWAELHKTILFVTHGIEESIYLADRVVVMTYRPGTVKRIVPVALPRPRDTASAEFNALKREVTALVMAEQARHEEEESSTRR